MLQDLYCVRSDLGNLLKAMGRLDEAKVCLLSSPLLQLLKVNIFVHMLPYLLCHSCSEVFNLKR